MRLAKWKDKIKEIVKPPDSYTYGNDNECSRMANVFKERYAPQERKVQRIMINVSWVIDKLRRFFR